ncbi:hypothetical protein PPL_08358 [Heterostelium album PN500]|uniref:B box-type domain-containing protein n=1 Tax=Heterostelium pallidum (strain ATCC 26659 / Pp 5 / PN500) TaxID=670386 RepID=D3BHZ0_HETP5|nr:hypothetical protein PPL_08358 [Heterostelium album PN500]EFA78890.1 hypothetical protein PPL_08358 [Heterostelium album PN500]|eukprot:XP_020431014.1 hypothetical protein PPL_08358 [Heterostelium album PN500]
MNNNSNNNNNYINQITETKCSEHEKEFEYLCFICNSILCSKCFFNHYKSNKDHDVESIDEIKKNLNNLSNNNDSDNYIKNSINNNLTSINRLSNQYTSLGGKVTEISNHFEKLHNFLMVEEHRLKKPISIDQDTVKEDLDKQLNELKSIINIINFNNNNINKKEVELDDDDDQNKSKKEDTTDLYSISTIFKSIEQSQPVIDFIERNYDTLFYCNNNNNMIGDLTNNLNNFDTTILKLITLYNSQFKSIKIDHSNNVIDRSVKHEIIFKDTDLELIKEILQSVSLKNENFHSPTTSAES